MPNIIFEIAISDAKNYLSVIIFFDPDFVIDMSQMQLAKSFKLT